MSARAVVRGFDRDAKTLECVNPESGAVYPDVIDTFWPTPPLATVALSDDPTPRVVHVVNRVEHLFFDHFTNALVSGEQSYSSFDIQFVPGMRSVNVLWGDTLWDLGEGTAPVTPGEPWDDGGPPTRYRTPPGGNGVATIDARPSGGVSRGRSIKKAPFPFDTHADRGLWARWRVLVTNPDITVHMSMDQVGFDHTLFQVIAGGVTDFAGSWHFIPTWVGGAPTFADSGIAYEADRWYDVEVMVIPGVAGALWISGVALGVYTHAVGEPGPACHLGISADGPSPSQGTGGLAHLDYAALSILDDPTDPSKVNLRGLGVL